MGDHKEYLIYGLIALIFLFPFLNAYLFLLDGSVSPNLKIEDGFYGKIDPQARIPFLLAFKSLDLFLTTAILQKLFLFLAIFLSAISMHNLIKTKSVLPRYFAGVLYAVNPFVYIRFMAGHWLLLLAYSITPFAIASIIKFFKNSNHKQSIKTALWITLIGILNLHNLFLILFLFLVFFIYFLFKENKVKLIKSTTILAIIFLALNIFWLIPLLTAEKTPITSITTQDLTIFATQRGLYNQFFHALMLYGFWREDAYILPMSFIPKYLYLSLFIIILFLAIHGFRNYKKEYKWPIAIAAILSSLLAVGIAHPWFEDIALFLFNNLYFMRGFREPHKFLAMLAFAYAFFGAYGLNAVMERFSKYKKYIFALSLLIILAYTPVMFGSFWGQLHPSDYPRDWYNLNTQLKREEQDFNILFLPWHGYMDFKFVKNQDKRIANPAKSFFNKNIIQAENIETYSLYTHSVNPIQPYIEAWLKGKNQTGLILARINVKYIILAKEADYIRHEWLLNDTDLELANETDTLILLKNKYKINKFYQSDDLETLYTLSYKKNSPISYTISKPEKKYVIFTDAYNKGWKLGKQEPLEGTTNVYEYKGDAELRYRRFNTYLVSYIISLAVFAGLVVILRKEDK